uniref:ATPase subunit 8 n=1 Tax=Aurelia sp. 4 sensu Dawson et al. (2005) TaxID=237397 RepID=A0A0E3VN62_9CNID|nr:ATPase subunit 8 [Aurelia sp. 4 sensu Dawson et al. (2005)]
MPQLDVITFVNQYVWIIGTVNVVVIIMLAVTLPSVKKLTQIRNITEEKDLDFRRKKDFEPLKRLVSF